MRKTSNKAVILARVSTKEQEEGFSLSAQEKLMRRYTNDNGLPVVRVFKMAESASKVKQRTVFKQMMEYVDKNRIKNVVVEKVDRITRSFKDMVMIDDWLEEDGDRQIHLVKDVLVMHRSSRSQDKLNWGVKVLFAKNYIDNLREEVKKGTLEKLEQGWLPGTPPPGYKNMINQDKKSIQVVDWSKAPLIQFMFELYNTGNYSLSMLAKEMQTAGLTTRNNKALPKTSIHRLLRKKYYIGIIEWDGKEYPSARHDSIIDPDVFEQVSYRMSHKTPPNYIKHKPLLSGKIKCSDCNSSITWYLSKGAWYGQCKGNKPCSAVRECAKLEEVEDQFVEYFDSLVSPSPAIMAWVRKELKEDNRADMQRQEASVKQLQRRQERLKSQIGILYEDRIDGRISVEQYDTKAKEKEAELKDTEESVARMTDSNINYREQGIEIIDMTQAVSEAYRASDKDTKRVLLGDIFSNITLNGKRLGVVWRPETEIIRNAVLQTKQLDEYFELSSDRSKKNLTKEVRSIWCMICDALQTAGINAQDDYKLKHLVDIFQLSDKLI